MDSDEVVSALVRGAGAAVKGFLPGPLVVASEVLGALSDALQSGDQRLARALQQEILDTVLSAVPELQKRVATLESSGVAIKLADVMRVAEHYTHAWRTAVDAKKRKLLEEAFVRSFDRELYESGLLNALWERLERLSYGDLFLLRDLVEAGDGGLRQVHQKYNTQKSASLGNFHARNLIREGLCWSSMGRDADADARPSELGEKLHALALAPREETTVREPTG